MSDLVGNPDDQFSHNKAQIKYAAVNTSFTTYIINVVFDVMVRKYDDLLCLFDGASAVKTIYTVPVICSLWNRSLQQKCSSFAANYIFLYDHALKNKYFELIDIFQLRLISHFQFQSTLFL